MATTQCTSAKSLFRAYSGQLITTNRALTKPSTSKSISLPISVRSRLGVGNYLKFVICRPVRASLARGRVIWIFQPRLLH